MRNLLAVAGCLMIGCSHQPEPVPLGKIAGKVSFSGEKPARKAITMDTDEDCKKAHPGEVLTEDAVISDSGAVANVFVYIKEGLEGKKFPPAAAAVKFDQKGCLFRPRVIGLQTGQTLAVTNSDPVSHNIHPLPRENREWNQGQSPGAAPLERQFAKPEIGIPVKCNVHAWMRGYVNVLEHPFFAVTGEDGRFEIKDVPAGEYTIEAWHEKLTPQTLKVTVAARAAASADFTLKGE